MLAHVAQKLVRKPKILQVVTYPSEILDTKSFPLTESISHNEYIQELILDMKHTLSSLRAIGLAAIQVGVPLKIMVIQDSKLTPITLINPTIKNQDGRQWESEGCLSFGGLYLKVKRPAEVEVEYFDEFGKLKTSIFTELLARAVSHEYQHLEGKTFLDSLSTVERNLARQKYRKINKMKF